MRNSPKGKFRTVVSWPEAGSFALDVFSSNRGDTQDVFVQRYQLTVKSAGFPNAHAIPAEATAN